MHIRRQPHFGNEGDPTPGHACGVGLLERQLQMRGFDRLRDFLRQAPGKSLAMMLLPVSRSRYFGSKNFSRMMPFGIDEEISGARKALLHSRGFRIENAVSRNDFGIRIPSSGYSILCRSRKNFRISSES